MAVNSVTLAELLRPWHSAGLSFILREPGAISIIDDMAPQTQTSSEERMVRPEGDSALLQGPGNTFSAIDTRNTASPVTRGQVPEVAFAGKKKEISLPLPWQQLLDKTPRAPLLWTYAELGLDLRGDGNKERAACLRTLIGRLSLPRGSSSFWPVAMESAFGSEGTVGAGESLYFQTGLAQLEPKVVVLLGKESIELSGLSLPLRISFTQSILQGRLFILLPSFTEFFENPVLLDRAAFYLTSAFNSLPTLFSFKG